MSKKKSDKIELLFAGDSSYGVTQSMYLVDSGDFRVLLDCGLYQSSDIVDSYKRNHRRLPFRANLLNAIIISHCNCDHIGYLPAIFRKGGSPLVYIPAGSKKLLELMLRDSVKIFENDILKLQRSHELKDATVLYDNDDVDACLANVIEIAPHETVYLNDYETFRYYEAGHIVKSCQVYLEIKRGNTIKRIGYTGDIGSEIEKYYNLSWEPLPFVDVLLGETTYAGEPRQHTRKDRDKDIEKIQSLVDEVCQEHNGKILAAVFSLDRLQTILTTLYALYHNNPACPQIVIDAPLGGRISDIYDNLIDINAELWRKVKEWDRVVWVSSWAESCRYQSSDKPMIILASSGMMTAGRVISHLKTVLPSQDNAILFCGYAGDGTLAARIKSGDEDVVDIEGTKVPNRARIVSLNSFSSHACRNELLRRYSSMDYTQIYLIHGDRHDTAVNDFAAELRDALSEQNKTSRVILPYLKCEALL